MSGTADSRLPDESTTPADDSSVAAGSDADEPVAAPRRRTSALLSIGRPRAEAHVHHSFRHRNADAASTVVYRPVPSLSLLLTCGRSGAVHPETCNASAICRARPETIKRNSTGRSARNRSISAIFGDIQGTAWFPATSTTAIVLAVPSVTSLFVRRWAPSKKHCSPSSPRYVVFPGATSALGQVFLFSAA